VFLVVIVLSDKIRFLEAVKPGQQKSHQNLFPNNLILLHSTPPILEIKPALIRFLSSCPLFGLLAGFLIGHSSYTPFSTSRDCLLPSNEVFSFFFFLDIFKKY
jgi:hypothetical protein